MPAPAVPEISEEVLHESIDARTETLVSLRELGPPDLVHLLKQNLRNAGRQVGVYHHVTGVDASSSASLAAYINTLTYREHGQAASQKIVEGIYCCYNAFSRLDMRVHVTIPGTVEAYCVDERGEKRKASDDLWLETYLCSVLRAYSYADDGSGDTIRKIMGVRRFNPVTNTETEHRFLSAAESLFFRGWQLGSDSVVQVPNNVSNHLTSGLLKYFHTTGRFASAINLFEKLRSQNVEVSSLLAKVLFMGNEEVQGVRVLYQALKESPMDYVMLDTQADFLLKKGFAAEDATLKEERLKMALGCADRSTIAAPSEFGTWAKLAQVYVAMEDWENALTILNSCPMFTYQDKDAPIMPEPKDVYLPTLPETRLDEIDSEPEARYAEQVDPSLLNLRAAAYKGTFKLAYNILTEMTAKIGWDQLLKIRSTVFVMEDEYRSERQDGAQQTQPLNRNPSMDGLRGTPEPPANGEEAGSDDEVEEEKKEDKGKEVEKEEGEDEKEEDEKTEKGEVESNGDGNEKKPVDADSQAPTITNGDGNADDEAVEKPTHTIDPRKVHADGDTTASTDEHLSRLNNKRLCERWLDSLFMVLYEDLRVYTIWRTQMAQYKAQSMQYRKSAEEWEILGALAERLQHPDEALEAYRACLAARFSPKALTGILRVFEKQKNTRDTVAALIRLVTWQYRWYSEFSPELLHTIRVLIEEEGAVKVRSIVQATNLPQNVLDLTHHYAALCATFRSSGTDG
ncbi:chaps-domain-containing protein [Xylariomycetidae sp. FL0641]|nr:chaps-domain-containing protein [Xylariomycetidae sp. FL0641]